MTAARHLAPTDSSRRSTAAVLALVSLAAVACAALERPWATWLGLGLVIVALVWMTWSSWRALDGQRDEHARQIRALRQQARADAHAHHLEMMAMVDRFETRIRAERDRNAELQNQLAAVERAEERDSAPVRLPRRAWRRDESRRTPVRRQA